jgi:hypothetical protein
MTKERKITKWEICDYHAGWFAGESRRRIAETFVEGGPGGMGTCRDGKCRLWPGRDFYVSDICTSELDLDWTDAA